MEIGNYTSLYGSAYDAALKTFLLGVGHLKTLCASRHADDEIWRRQLPHVEQQWTQLLYYRELLIHSAFRREADSDVLRCLLRGVCKAEFAERICARLAGALVVWTPLVAGCLSSFRVASLSRLNCVSALAKASANVSVLVLWILYYLHIPKSEQYDIFMYSTWTNTWVPLRFHCLFSIKIIQYICS